MSAAKPKKSRKGRLRRWLIGLAIGTPVAVILLWIAVHRIPWLGPMFANGLRAVIGTERVAKLDAQEAMAV